MKRTTVWFASASLVAIAIAGAMLVYISLNGSALPKVESRMAPSTGMSQSSDKVRVRAAVVPASTGTWKLTLDIEEGWHVNATPASMDFLIPTTVSIQVNGTSVDVPVLYPPGRKSDITLDGTALEVYDDGATISFSANQTIGRNITTADELDISLQVQSCDDSGICLAPSTIPVHMPKN